MASAAREGSACPNPRIHPRPLHKTYLVRNHGAKAEVNSCVGRLRVSDRPIPLSEVVHDQVRRKKSNPILEIEFAILQCNILRSNELQAEANVRRERTGRIHVHVCACMCVRA